MNTPATKIIQQRAAQYGFDQVRFAPVLPAPGIDAYDRFLAEGRQGDMSWMHTGREPRSDPRTLLPSASAVGDRAQTTRRGASGAIEDPSGRVPAARSRDLPAAAA